MSPLVILLQAAGWAAARTPESLLALAARAGGWLVHALAGATRRRDQRRKQHHPNPERTEEWRRRIGRESCRRMVETLFFLLALPHWSPQRLRRMVTLDPETDRQIAELEAAEAKIVALVTHLAPWEAASLIPVVRRGGAGRLRFGAVYRPPNQRPVDAWVRRTREVHGVRLFSRKGGVLAAIRFAQGGGWLGLLVDQNAGNAGCLSFFCDRVCSTTDLAGVVAQAAGARVGTFYPRRTAFFRYTLHGELLDLPAGPEPEAVALAGDAWLEARLRGDEELCASWLWLHRRWRTQWHPSGCLRLRQKRSLLDHPGLRRRHPVPPRRTRFLVRLPADPVRALAALPLLRAMARGRPDGEFVAWVPEAAAGWVAAVAEGWPLRVVPAGGWAARAPAARALRGEYFDFAILLEGGDEEAREARLAGAAQRVGRAGPGGRRGRDLTHAVVVAGAARSGPGDGLGEGMAFLAGCGLEEPADRRPWREAGAVRPVDGPVGYAAVADGTVGLGAGAWTVEAAEALVAAVRRSGAGIAIRPLAVAEAATPAGRPAELARELAACRVVVAADARAAHLANALGVPVVAVGPAARGEPPVHEAPVVVVPAGEGEPEAAVRAVLALLRAGSAPRDPAAASPDSEAEAGAGRPPG